MEMRDVGRREEDVGISLDAPLDNALDNAGDRADLTAGACDSREMVWLPATIGDCMRMDSWLVRPRRRREGELNFLEGGREVKPVFPEVRDIRAVIDDALVRVSVTAAAAPGRARALAVEVSWAWAELARGLRESYGRWPMMSPEA
eukprot:3150644-Prymnesium_polylepis.1